MTFLNRTAPSGHRVCVHLRTKEMYYTTEFDEASRHGYVNEASDDQHLYWCARTCRAISSRAEDVSLDACRPTRDCYEGLGGSINPS